ncbi:MAG: NAD(+) synthase [Oscillospiraceae bacterium]
MNTIVRVASAVNRVKVADTDFTFGKIVEIIDTLKDNPADIIVFPSLAISSASCGILFGNKALLDNAKECIENICILTQDLATFILIGTPIEDNGKVVSVIAVLHKGEIVGYVQGQDDRMGFLSQDYSSVILPPTTVFGCGGLKFCILSCEPLALTQKAKDIAATGCDLIVVPSYSPSKAAYQKDVKSVVSAVSRTYGCAIAVVNGGIGDTTSPYVYRGFSMIYECGKLLQEKTFDEQDTTMCDLDVDIIRAEKISVGQDLPYYIASIAKGKQKLLRPIPMNPYLPQNPFEADEYVEELFTLQCLSLKGRLENVGIGKIVIGFSGGLDSTLALLVAAKTMDMMKLPRENIIALRMPSFGTSERTSGNAEVLAEILSVTSREISIESAVIQHLADIGHDGVTQDVTYENAQARERTQIAFDIGNMEKALVLGTGDLSEIALGWCTFGGDHLSGYNVNASITKTIAKKIVSHIAMNDVFEGTSRILMDIVETPISPELVGGGKKIMQKTEEILGPYELHEFFLYHMLKYGFRPSKIYYYACFAFVGILEPEFIKDKLELFLRRFFSSQFKRSTSSDSAILCEGTFGQGFYMPSDINADMYIKELKTASFR